MKQTIILLIFLLLINFTLIGQTLEKKWLTDFEKSNYTATSNYDETINYLKKLEAASPYIKLITFGQSPQGRQLYAAIVSRQKLFNPSEIKKKGLPILLIQNGIHAGEIEGKDACLLLLRDILITKTKAKYLDNCVLIVIPIFNVDGHERMSKYNRINQNGPKEMGWRATAQNLNLNRDYMKADSPEMINWLKFFTKWLPDFFIDTHTTDGADYQYTITYNISDGENQYPQTIEWIKSSLIPYFENKVEKEGYLIFPYVAFKGSKLEDGLVDWVPTPRFSNGYVPLQNRPALLIETHMLKSYKDRVYSTKFLIEAVIEKINDDSQKLVKMNKDADNWVIENYFYKKKPLPLSFSVTDKNKIIIFKGFNSIEKESGITGNKVLVYTNTPVDFNIPFYYDLNVKDSVYVPKAYLIPKEWNEIVDKLKLHGVIIDTVRTSEQAVVEKYKFYDVKFSNSSFEGHQRPIYKYNVIIDTLRLKKGDYIIRTDQRTLQIIVNLLEPLSQDSFIAWGFFNTIFERKEYFEVYSMNKIAEEMISENPKLKEEFLRKLQEDENFRNNSYMRLMYFYEKSPYSDKYLNQYPVLRIIKELPN
ncbi:M14 family metallopeptidase [Melioribacteraceae bacterium 4301-Me]|uniref:M14 family metallopeptidase n=1 Tax=Pyranulibacter aquaticus TaxID=3163344 RepID=UPI003599031C